MLSFYISFIYSTLPNTAAPKQKRRLGTCTHIYKVQREEKRSFVTHMPTHERCNNEFHKTLIYTENKTLNFIWSVFSPFLCVDSF